MSKHPHQLSVQQRALLQAELDHGERIVWAGRPHWRYDIAEYLILAVFGLAWSGICFPAAFFAWSEALGFIQTSRTTANAIAKWGFALFLVPFAAIGAGLLLAPALGIARKLHTLHAVTNRRLITLIDRRKKEVDSRFLKSITFINRRDHGRGLGSLTIGVGTEKDFEGDTRPVAIYWSGIDDAEAVERAIREARGRADR